MEKVEKFEKNYFLLFKKEMTTEAAAGAAPIEAQQTFSPQVASYFEQLKVAFEELRQRYPPEEMPENYKLNFRKLVEPYIEAALRTNDHLVVAMLFWLLDGENIKYIGEKGHNCYIWNSASKLWEERNSKFVNQRFIEAMKPTIYKYYIRMLARAQESGDAKDQERFDTLAKLALAAMTKFGTTEFFGKVRPLIEVLFYDPNFTKKLNSNPDLLPLMGGIVFDLKEMGTRERMREDFFTKEIPVEWDDDITSEVAHKFISDMFLDNKDMIYFIQTWLGYLLTGHTREQKFAIFYETGSNGKSMLMQAIANVLGPLYLQASPELFVKMKRSAGSATEHIANLFEKRAAVFEETEDEECLNEAQIKSMTGGEILTARKLYGSLMQFQNTAKFMLCTNFKPKTSSDPAFWRRVLLIPCEAKFVDKPLEQCSGNERPMDKEIATKIKEPAFKMSMLRFMVNGADQWYREGLKVPVKIKDFTQDHRKDQDVIGAFLEDCEIYETGTQATELLNHFCQSDDIDSREWTATKFGLQLASRNIRGVQLVKKRKSAGIFWNIRVKPEVKTTVAKKTDRQVFGHGTIIDL
ncbi:MAG: hypothetical protein K2Q22_09385 [Cytophagales bacterium]|nr:hypothetical protein [Cytophagales bacterium]